MPHCPKDGTVVNRQTPQQIVDRVLELAEGTRFQVLAPIVRGRKGTYDTLLADLATQGFARVRLDGEVRELAELVSQGAELARYEMHTIEVVVDRLVLREGIERRLTDSLETALQLAEGTAEIELVPRDGQGLGDEEREVLTFSQHLACPTCGTSYGELAPRNFSFNSPYGACTSCDGLGTKFEVDPELVVPNPDLTLEDGAIAPWASGHSQYFKRLIEAVAEDNDIPVHEPWRDLPDKARKLLLHGAGDKRVHVKYKNRYGRSRSYHAKYEGAVPYLQRRHSEAESDAAREQIEGYMREVACPECEGARLLPLSLGVTIDGRNIHELCSLPIGESTQMIRALELSERDRMIAEAVLKEVQARMGFLLDVGLDYLSLHRNAGTLAGGEAQRIRLASQIGSGLVGVLYVLDEPSIGLHQRDNKRLIETLMRLRDLGNTVLVVEHDEETIRVADHVVDIGPGAGEHGGQVVHSGTREGPPAQQGVRHRSVPLRAQGHPRARDAPPARRGVAGGPGCPRAQPEGPRRRVPPGLLRVRHRRVRLRQVDPGQRHPLPGAHAADLQVQVAPGPPHRGRRPRRPRQGHRHRPVADRAHAAVEPRHLHRGLRPHPQALRPDQRGQGPRLPAGPVLLQRQGRALRSLRRRRDDQDRDALPARRVRALRGVQGGALQPGHAGHRVQGQEHRRGPGPVLRGGPGLLRQPAGHRPPHADASWTWAWATSAWASPPRRCRAARPSG